MSEQANAARVKPIELNKGIKGNGSIWKIYHTERGRKIALARYIRSGNMYFVCWKDTQGFGLETLRRATWQDEGWRHPYINW